MNFKKKITSGLMFRTTIMLTVEAMNLVYFAIMSSIKHS